MIKNPVTITLSREDRERRNKWRAHQLHCAKLLRQHTAAELQLELALEKLKQAQGAAPDVEEHDDFKTR